MRSVPVPLLSAGRQRHSAFLSSIGKDEAIVREELETLLAGEGPAGGVKSASMSDHAHHFPALALVAIGVGAALVSQRLLAPIQTLTEGVKAVAAGDLDARTLAHALDEVPVPRHIEFR